MPSIEFDPSNNGGLMLVADDIREHEYTRGFTAGEESAAETVATLTEERDGLRREVADLNAWREAHMREVAPAGHPTSEPDPDPDPDPDPGPTIAERIQGTWVLQQVGSVAELNRLRPQILAAAAWEGVVGISIRYPWNAADLTGSQTSNALLDAIADLVEESGKAGSIRFMAGRHTPGRVFDAGAANLNFNGQRAPVPWDNTSGTVQVFLDHYRDYTGRLATWCREHGFPLLHGSWYALDWAELNHGKEIRAVSGYTQDRWLEGHRRLISTLASHRADDLAVELPMSGYGPLSSGQSAALVDHAISVVGEDADNFYIQANGWGPNGEWGAPSQQVENDFDRIWPKPIKRGLQMIQPQDYDWGPVFARLNANDATYAEVYLPSFTLAHAQQLRTEIAAFKEN